MTNKPILRRSMLFVPGLRDDRYDKAAATGADMICVDLEDSVAPAMKAEARAKALPYFTRQPATPVRRMMRINSPRSEDGLRDMHALLDAEALPDGIVLPKIESADEAQWVAGLLGPKKPDLDIIAVVESVRGINRLDEIAHSTPFVKAVSLGSADLVAETNSDMGWDALLYARSKVVYAAAGAGIDALDGVWLDIPDIDGAREEARKLKTMGFAGRAAIHPAQVAPIHDAYTPTKAEVERAQKIVDAFETNTSGILQVDGIMVDYPVVVAARRLLAMVG